MVHKWSSLQRLVFIWLKKYQESLGWLPTFIHQELLHNNPDFHTFKKKKLRDLAALDPLSCRCDKWPEPERAALQNVTVLSGSPEHPPLLVYSFSNVHVHEHHLLK